MPFIQFVRVRDKDTGHEYDVIVSAVDDAAHTVLKDYPSNQTGQVRPPKHRILTAGKTANTPKEK